MSDSFHRLRLYQRSSDGDCSPNGWRTNNHFGRHLVISGKAKYIGQM